MKQFVNVSVELAGNSYFEGAVTSRTLRFSDGSRKTLGFMLPGTYSFGTGVAELMEITSGDVRVKLPDSDEWMSVQSGEFFNVPEKSSFDIEVKSITDYCCSYL
jgi:uncharacterized protein YaiE (UPF0345 family)